MASLLWLRIRLMNLFIHFVIFPPVVDIQGCIQTAIRLFQATPISAYMREYQVGSMLSESIPPEAVSLICLALLDLVVQIMKGINFALQFGGFDFYSWNLAVQTQLSS